MEVEPPEGSDLYDWAALFRVRTAHLPQEEGPRKGGLKIAHLHTFLGGKPHPPRHLNIAVVNN